MVGHFWLRAPELAPTAEDGVAIGAAVDAVEKFAAEVHAGRTAAKSGSFEHVIHIGIGGSVVGPQLVCDALKTNHLRGGLCRGVGVRKGE